MRTLLACCVILALAAPAPAHFIWLIPVGDPESGTTALMIFSDTLEPDANVPVSKIARTKLFARAGARGDEIPVKTSETNHAYRVTAGETPVMIGGVCEYGVITKGQGKPFLLMYYPQTVLRKGVEAMPDWVKEPVAQFPLNFAPGDKGDTIKVLWQGKPAPYVEVALLGPGLKEPAEFKTDERGQVKLPEPDAPGVYGLRAKYVEARSGELGGKKYDEVHHYATLTMRVEKHAEPQAKTPALAPKEAPQPPASLSPDPAATKLLADARAARAVWRDFPGFRADVAVNIEWQVHSGKVEVSSQGKVKLELAGGDSDTAAWARREIASLVAHRLPGQTLQTPCAFADDITDHPLGRLIRILNDELHSSYRIRDRQIIEVNRSMKDTRFTITVLESTLTKDHQYLPAAYVVNSWEVNGNTLLSSIAHHQTWTRVGAFDMPASLLWVKATPGKLDSRRLTFTNIELTR